MSIASIPEVVQEKFGNLLLSSAGQILHLCKNAPSPEERPSRFFVQLAVPIDDRQEPPVLHIFISMAHGSIEHDPAHASDHQSGLSEDNTPPLLPIAELFLTVGTDDQVRLGPQQGETATPDAIYEECLQQTQAAWLCAHTGTPWSPDLRIDTMAPEWRNQWVMH